MPAARLQAAQRGSHVAGAAACEADHTREAAGRGSRSAGCWADSERGRPNGWEGLRAACRAPALGHGPPRQGRAVGRLGARCNGPHSRCPVAPPARALPARCRLPQPSP